MSEREEVLLESAWILHHRRYRNTSLIIDCLTGDFGRQTLVARGARRPGARQSPLLQSFQPLRLSWVRRSEMGSLTDVESAAPALGLSGDGLYAGFYVNELMLRLVPRGDPNESIMSCYSKCLDRLAHSHDVAGSLRVFELDLLDALGYRVDLDNDFRTGKPIDPGLEYVFEHEGGLTVSAASDSIRTYSGRHILALGQHELSDPDTLRAARQLLAGILDTHLGEKPLKTRAVMREIAGAGMRRQS